MKYRLVALISFVAILSFANAYSMSSPHWNHINTFDIITSVDANGMSQRLGMSQEQAMQTLRKWSAMQDDLVIAAPEFMDKARYNPNGKIFSPLGNWFHMAPEEEGYYSVITFLRGYAQTHGTNFEDYFLHARDDQDYCTDVAGRPLIKGWNPLDDTNGDGVREIDPPSDPARTALNRQEARFRPEWDCNTVMLNVPNKATQDALFAFWTTRATEYLKDFHNPDDGSPSLSYGSDGEYWVSGTDGFSAAHEFFPTSTVEYGILPDEIRQNFVLNNVTDLVSRIQAEYSKPSLNLKTIVNMTWWKTPAEHFFMSGANGVMWENLATNEWDIEDYFGLMTDRPSDETGPIPTDSFLYAQRQIQRFASSYPQGTLLIQLGGYGGAELYADWRPCGSRDLAERMQTRELAKYYLLKPDSLSYYRYAGEGCYPTTPVSGSHAWTYDETGTLPKSVSYDIGAPAGKAYVFRNVTVQAMFPNNASVTDLQTVVLARGFAHATAYFRPSKWGLHRYDGYGNDDAEKRLLGEDSLKRKDGSSDFPLALPQKGLLLKYDGSLVGPISRISLLQNDGAIVVHSPLKADSLSPTIFDASFSTTSWWPETAVENRTLISFRKLSMDEFFSDTGIRRAARVALDNSSARIDFLNDLNLDATANYDADANTVVLANLVSVNRAALPDFDKPALITFRNVSLLNPQPMKDNKTCGDSVCVAVSWDNSTFSFAVAGFDGAYSLSEGGANKTYSTTTTTSTTTTDTWSDDSSSTTTTFEDGVTDSTEGSDGGENQVGDSSPSTDSTTSTLSQQAIDSGVSLLLRMDAPESVKAGEPGTVAVTVSNSGTKGAYGARLSLGAQTEVLDILPREEKKLSLEFFAPEEEGVFAVTVTLEGPDGTHSETATMNSTSNDFFFHVFANGREIGDTRLQAPANASWTVRDEVNATRIEFELNFDGQPLLFEQPSGNSSYEQSASLDKPGEYVFTARAMNGLNVLRSGRRTLHLQGGSAIDAVGIGLLAIFLIIGYLLLKFGLKIIAKAAHEPTENEKIFLNPKDEWREMLPKEKED